MGTNKSHKREEASQLSVLKIEMLLDGLGEGWALFILLL